MRDDDEEIVEVRVDLTADVCELARERGMALEDYLSVLIRCDIEGTVPLRHRLENASGLPQKQLS